MHQPWPSKNRRGAEDRSRSHAIQYCATTTVALIAGILILMIPRLLNYIVALYLIVTGILGLIRV